MMQSKLLQAALVVLAGGFLSSQTTLRAQAAKPATKINVGAAPATFVVGAANPALLQPRFALVIGNNNYPLEPLVNPVNDAALLDNTLRRLNFKVTRRENLNLAQMREALKLFSQQLPKDAVALFYYAGHGVQIKGRNFLLPTDFKINTPEAAQASMLELNEVLTWITAKSGLGIIILDACRNTPDKLSIPDAEESGFAEIKSPAGVILAFSTAPGTTASDGEGKNSPYAEALARNLLLRPARLEDVFIKTRIELVRSLNQLPWENAALQTIFYFTEDSAKPAVTATVNLPYLRPHLIAANQLRSYTFTTPLLNAEGTRVKTLNGAAKSYLERGVEMVEIVGGKFLMGSGAEAVTEAFRDAQRYNDDITLDTMAAEMPQHFVTVPGFYLSKYEITQGQWEALMGHLPNIPAAKRGADLPVVNVSWREANSFCEKLSQLSGRIYRLPSEAQWEYAARGGRESFFPFGDNLTSDLVNYNTSAPFGDAGRAQPRNTLAPVGFSRAYNAFGLADMAGNVWEWCADGWNPDYDGAPTDGSAWPPQNKSRYST